MFIAVVADELYSNLFGGSHLAQAIRTDFTFLVYITCFLAKYNYRYILYIFTYYSHSTRKFRYLT